MKFSVITASYNPGDSIIKTYHSLLLQDKKLFEWIIVDGKSGLDSQSILQKVVKEAPFPITYVSESDKGVFDAFNKGIKIAKGEFVSFLGCGDGYYPRVLESIEDCIDTGDDADVVYGIVDFIRQDGAHYWYATDEKYLEEGRMMHHAAAFVRKDRYIEIGGFETKYRSASDLDAFIKIKRLGAKFVFVPYVVSYFYAGGLSTTGGLPYEEQMEIMHDFNMLTHKRWVRFLLRKEMKKISSSLHTLSKVSPRS